MVSDGVGGYHGRAELGLFRRRDQGGVRAGDERVCKVCGVISRRRVARGVGLGLGLCGPMIHAPLGGSTKGGRQTFKLFPAIQQGGSSSVALPLLVERIVCAVIEAPTAQLLTTTLANFQESQISRSRSWAKLILQRGPFLAFL